MYKAKLLSSGIHPERGRELLLIDCPTAPPTLPISHQGENTRGMAIVYTNLDGIKTGFYRYRYYTPHSPRVSEWAKSKPIRYTQPQGHAPALYYPRIEGLDWRVVSKEKDAPVIITEGELKAVACCIGVPTQTEGYGGIATIGFSGRATIGLGGVWNWRKDGTPIKDFDEWCWSDREVFIIFDSDVADRPDLKIAQYMLANELDKRGAQVYVGQVPSDGRKMGLDDYILEGGDIDELLMDAEEHGVSRQIREVSEYCIIVKKPTGYLYNIGGNEWELKNRVHIQTLMADKQYIEKIVDGKGVVKYKTHRLLDKWEESPFRVVVDKLDYLPGEMEKIVDNKWNTWQGWGVEPCRGGVELFKTLMGYLLTGLTPEEQNWVYCWLAFPLQYPGTKMFSALVLWGTGKGTGKSSLGLTMAQIYGSNYVKVGKKDLNKNFNSHLKDKQFAMGEEITSGEGREFNDYLKEIITQKTVLIEEKYITARQVTDRLNWFFNSNDPQAFFLEEGDRRYFVHQVPRTPMSQQFYTDYWHWLDNGGAGAIFDYLLSYDVVGFNPSAPPPVTESKINMEEMGQSDLYRFIKDLRNNPDMLKVNGLYIPYCLVTAAEVKYFYDPEGMAGRINTGTVGKIMVQVGFTTVMGGRQIKIKGSSKVLYILRDHTEFITMVKPEEVARFYEMEREMTSRKF